MDNRKPIHHFSIPENEQHKLVVQQVKRIDRAIMGTIREIAKDAGITDVYLVDENFVVNALKRQIPMEPDSHEHQWHMYHNCPVCGNNLKPPGVLQFKNGSYCDQCGQKIQWGDCSD